MVGNDGITDITQNLFLHFQPDLLKPQPRTDAIPTHHCSARSPSQLQAPQPLNSLFVLITTYTIVIHLLVPLGHIEFSKQ